MPRKLRSVLSASVALVLVPSLARAQTAAPTSVATSGNSTRTGSGRNGHSTAFPGASAQPADPGLISTMAGGSMLRATLSSPVDPEAATLKDISYFSVPVPEPRTIKKHDLVTIIVNESSEFSSKGTTDLKKSADFDAKLDAFVRFSLSNFAIKSNGTTVIPEIKTEGKRDFKGDGSVDRSDSFTTRITAEVLDVKPNNTLVIQARQHIRSDEEEQTMILSGICRVDDITPDNTVLSTQLFDKDVTKTSRGAVADTNKRGWVPKLLDVINPF